MLRTAQGKRRKIDKGQTVWSIMKKRGFVLPGYNYLGPFNAEDNGPPTNPTDKAANVHDKEYKQISAKEGYWTPYYKYNHADEKFLQDIKDETDYGAYIASAAFKTKRAAARAGLLPHYITPERRPKLRKGFSPYQKRPPLKIPTDKNGDSQIQPNGVPFSNFQRSAQMSQPTGSGNDAGLKETPIDPVPRSISRGPPEYTFASLPFIETRAIDTSVYARDMVFRMTSPYDPAVSLETVDINSHAQGSTNHTRALADSADNTAAKTRWWDMYAGLYKYYHVVSCRWRITIENLGSQMIWAHVMYYNEDEPPVGATNDDMLCWKECESHLIGTHYLSVINGRLEMAEFPGDPNQAKDYANDEAGVVSGINNYESGNNISRTQGGLSPTLQLSGEYRPGDYNREIRLDSQVENWTAVTANPALPERLLIRFKHWNQGVSDNNDKSYNQTIVVNYRLQLDYLVEFKELKDGVRWPVAKQPITVSINQTIT